MVLNSSVLVIGGAGFVGSHLVDRLLDDGNEVTVLDNQSTGQRPFLKSASMNPKFQWNSGEIRNRSVLDKVMADKDIVFHFAANADIRHGAEHPTLDVEQNTFTTLAILESMRRTGVKHIVFASTGAVYGNPTSVPIPEIAATPSAQTSLYGASKLASEAVITAYCHTFMLNSTIFRFVPMIGERYSHGHIFDFVKKLRNDPTCIEIFGTGVERKYCIYVKDSVEAMMLALRKCPTNNNVFNIGNDMPYTINECVGWVADAMNAKPVYKHTGSRWAGDNPDLYLDCMRLKSMGWKPSVSLRDGVLATVYYLLDNPWLLDARE